jgi:hypothetical protein
LKKEGDRRKSENPGFGISNIETLTRTDLFLISFFFASGGQNPF